MEGIGRKVVASSGHAFAQLTLNAPYNDLSAVERLFAEPKNKIAAMIVEPLAPNTPVVGSGAAPTGVTVTRLE